MKTGRTLPILTGAILIGMLATQCTIFDRTIVLSPVAESHPTSTPKLLVTLETRTPLATAGAEVVVAPRNTPAPTLPPTPRSYEVESGDTLIQIAVNTQSDLDELLALNPNITPEFLSVGQTILLPDLKAQIEVTGLTSIDLPGIEVERVSVYKKHTGTVWVVGQVRNGGSGAVSDLRVAVNLLARDGSLVETADAWLRPGVVAIGGVAPFGVRFDYPSDDYQRAEVVLVNGEPVIEMGTRYQDLIATGSLASVDEFRISLSGEVENTGASAAEAVTVVAIFYDQQDQVLGYNIASLEGVLESGLSASYHIIAAPPGGIPTSFVLLAEGIRID